MSQDRPPWCFESKYYIKDEGTKKSWGCFETKGLCNSARKITEKYGSLADVRSVTTCERK